MGNMVRMDSTAEKLYQWVKGLPIIDYHNHLSVKDLTDNTRFFYI